MNPDERLMFDRQARWALDIDYHFGKSLSALRDSNGFQRAHDAYGEAGRSLIVGTSAQEGGD